MPERLVDRLRQLSLDDETQLRISLFPECLFGFPPKNLTELLERFDCPQCRRIVDLVAEQVDLVRSLEQRVDEFCQPTKDANETDQRNYERRCRWAWIFKGLVKKPVERPMPDHTSQPWYIAGARRKDQIDDELTNLKLMHQEHWAEGKPKELSHELIGRFFGRECFVVS